MPILDLSPGDQTLTLTGDVTLTEVYAARRMRCGFVDAS